MDIESVRALARNVERLMEYEGPATQKEVARRAGISQRAVSDLLNYGGTSSKAPTMKTLEGLARAFDVEPWMLLIPDMPIELLRNRRLSALIKNYRDAPEIGRETVDRIAEGEVRIANSRKAGWSLGS